MSGTDGAGSPCVGNPESPEATSVPDPANSGPRPIEVNLPVEDGTRKEVSGSEPFVCRGPRAPLSSRDRKSDDDGFPLRFHELCWFVPDVASLPVPNEMLSWNRFFSDQNP